MSWGKFGASVEFEFTMFTEAIDADSVFWWLGSSSGFQSECICVPCGGGGQAKATLFCRWRVSLYLFYQFYHSYRIKALNHIHSSVCLPETMASFRPERRAPGDYGDMKGITQEQLIASP